MTNESDSDEAFLTQQLNQLQKQFDDLKSENERTKTHAEAKELDASLRGELAKHQFATPVASEDLFGILRPRLKRTDWGIFSDDARCLSEFVKKEYEERPWMTPAKHAQGGPSRAAMIDLEQIKPGITAEQRAGATEAIRRALGL